MQQPQQDPSITLDQAQQMLEDSTNISWREINPSELKYYSSMRSTEAVFVCTDNQCKYGAYFVPEYAQPKLSYYQAVLEFAKQHGLDMLPTVKCDLDKFPPIAKVTNMYDVTITYSMKFDGDLLIRRAGSRNPMTYSVGQLHNFKMQSLRKVHSYLGQWVIEGFLPKNSTEVEITIGCSVTGESYKATAKLTGNTFTFTVTPKPISVDYQGWEIEGQCSLQIKGEFDQNQPLTAPVPAHSYASDFSESSSSHTAAATTLTLGTVLTFILIGAACA